MSYATAATAINTDAVRQRVRVAIVAFALNVLNTEATSNPATTHQARVALAQLVLADPDQHAPRFAVAIIANNQAAASDLDIDTALGAIWSAMAGLAANA